MLKGVTPLLFGGLSVLLVPVRNNRNTEHILCGENITLPSKTWVEIPVEAAFRFKNDPGLTFDWSVLNKQAIDKEGDTRHIAIVTPVNPNEGYGLGGLMAITAMQMRGIKVHLEKKNPPNRDQIKKHYPDVYDLIDKPSVITKWGFAHTWPPDFGLLNAAHRIGWTMWEAVRLPRNWLPNLELVERLIVPTEGQVEIFRKNFAGPIDVIPYGIDFRHWTQCNRPDRDTFTFLCWGRLTARKCPIDLIECFWRAFPNNKDVRLVLKTREGDLGSGRIKFKINDPFNRITVIDENWTVEQMVKLAHDADCGVFLSHGEGFGLPAVQAMATGLPVILSNHSGQSDFANKRYNYPVGLDPKTPFEPSPLGFGAYDQIDWWLSDYEQTIDLMKQVYEKRKDAKKKGAKAAVWVREKFSMENMADKLAEYIKALD